MSFLQKLKSYTWNRTFAKRIGVVVLFYLVVVMVTVFYLDAHTNNGQTIEVPNLIGKPVRVIGAELEALDLTYEVLDSIYDPSKPEGTILDQNPDPTSISNVYVKEGRIIKVRVSKKTRLIEMPSLIDKSQRFAESILKNRGLKYRIEYKPTNESNGAVMNQLYKGEFIKDGTRIPIGSTITLVVGRKEEGEPIDVPNLVGLTITEARDRLLLFGSVSLFTVCPDCISKEDSLYARIQSQTPEFIDGVKIPGGTTITVYASKNPQ
jgi:beta-lactam-binding protein with PASTA domain